MKEHSRSKACKVIGEVGGPIIAFELRDFKVPGEWCLYNFDVKRWVIAKLVVQ